MEMEKIAHHKLFALENRKVSRGHRILKKLAHEFVLAGFSGIPNFNKEALADYEFPFAKCKQKQITTIDFDELLYIPLYAGSQRQLNTSFSWIAPFQFFNGDVVSFYLTAGNFEKYYNNPEIFQVKPLYPPVLPAKSNAKAVPVTLVSIAKDYVRHLYAQEKLFMEKCGHLIAGR